MASFNLTCLVGSPLSYADQEQGYRIHTRFKLPAAPFPETLYRYPPEAKEGNLFHAIRERNPDPFSCYPEEAEGGSGFLSRISPFSNPGASMKNSLCQGNVEYRSVGREDMPQKPLTQVIIIRYIAPFLDINRVGL